MLAIYDHRTIFSDLALLGIWLFSLASLLKLHLLNGAWDNFLNKLMSFSIFHFIIVSFTLVWEDHVALLWASCILNSIATGDTLSVFNHVMLSCCILHVNEATSGWNLRWIEKLRLRLIVVFFLEGIKQVMCCILRSFNLFHLFPYILNVKVHYFLLVFDIEAGARITRPLYMPWWRHLLLRRCDHRFLRVYNGEFGVFIRASQVNLCDEGLSWVGRLHIFLLGGWELSLFRNMQISWRSHWLSSWFAEHLICIDFRHILYLFILLPVKLRLDLNSLHLFLAELLIIPAQLIFHSASCCLSGCIQPWNNFSHCRLVLYGPSWCAAYHPFVQLYGLIGYSWLPSGTHKLGLCLWWQKCLCVVSLLSAFGCLEVEGLWNRLFWWERIVLKHTFFDGWGFEGHSFCLWTIFGWGDFQDILIVTSWWHVTIKHIFKLLVLIINLIFDLSLKFLCDTLLQIFIETVLRGNTKLNRLLGLSRTLSWWFCEPTKLTHWGVVSQTTINFGLWNFRG